MSKDYEVKMKNYEDIIKKNKITMEDAERQLIVEKTRKEQFEKQLEDLKKESKDTFGVEIEDLPAYIEKNMQSLESLTAALNSIPQDIGQVTQEQVDLFDEKF